MIENDFQLLSGTPYSNTPLYASLLGLRKTLSSHLNITENIPLITHNNQKSIFRRESVQKYPYSYILLNDFRIIRDQAPNKTIARRGSHISLSEITNSSVKKGYLFRSEINFEFHWIHNSITDVINFVEKITILGAIDGFTFNVKIPDIEEWVATVELPDNAITFPRNELEDPAEPSAMDVTVSMLLKTRAGIVRDVPKVNNRGEVTQSFNVDKNAI